MAHLLIAFMRLIARWPLPLVRALGTGLGAVLWLLAARRRHIADVNLRLCFPEWSDAQRRRMVWRHFRAFGQSVLDRAWLWHAPESVLRARLQWCGDVQALRAPGPLVVFAPHFVGLDVGWTMLALSVDRAFTTIYTQQSNELIDRWVEQGRGRWGQVR